MAYACIIRVASRGFGRFKVFNNTLISCDQLLNEPKPRQSPRRLLEFFVAILQWQINKVIGPPRTSLLLPTHLRNDLNPSLRATRRIHPAAVPLRASVAIFFPNGEGLVRILNVRQRPQLPPLGFPGGHAVAAIYHRAL